MVYFLPPFMGFSRSRSTSMKKRGLDGSLSLFIVHQTYLHQTSLAENRQPSHGQQVSGGQVDNASRVPTNPTRAIGENKMSKKNEPVIDGKAGRGISILVFENEGQKGKYYTASINRPYEDKSGETTWQRVSMPAEDLLLVADEAMQVFREYKKMKK